MVLNFSYLAIKLPRFKSGDKKLPELEPSDETFLCQNLVLYMRYHNFFPAILKALPLIYPYG